MMNVGRGERIFRFVIGVVLIVLGFLSRAYGVDTGTDRGGNYPTAIFGY